MLFSSDVAGSSRRSPNYVCMIRQKNRFLADGAQRGTEESFVSTDTNQSIRNLQKEEGQV
jgi:hypothetical protein